MLGLVKIQILKNYMGVDMDDYEDSEDVNETMDAVCTICSGEIEEVDRRIIEDIDRDHDTPRGILCTDCSTAIYHMKFDPEILKKASEYCEYWLEENRPIFRMKKRKRTRG
jgi:hypothetical protein